MAFRSNCPKISKHLAIVFTASAIGITFAQAATDITTAPLVTSSTTQVKPNLMFILDDSGSMAWTHMPDSAVNYHAAVGYRNHFCNSIYYDPGTTYTAPIDSTGTSYADMTDFTAVKYNGFDSSSATVNLSTSFQAFDTTTTRYADWQGSDTAQAAYYYQFNGTGTPTSAQCAEAPSSTSPYNSTNFTYIAVGSSADTTPGTTAQQKQNFANWYSYYRTRMLMMKTAAGIAFRNIDDKYRVGFSTINYTGVDSSNAKFLKIADFSATQKQSWYSKFYAITPSGGTPLRAALSKAGRIYAGQLLTGSDDPVQYSCQQNFTILSTDGYWNGDAGYKIDGTSAIGNQDNTEDRPRYDGSGTKTTTVTTTTTTTQSLVSSGCTGGRKKIQTVTDMYQDTVVTFNGATLSDSGSVHVSGYPSTSTSTCQSNPTLQSPNPQTTTSTSVTSQVTTDISNTLSDVAMYYYKTDLRTTALGNCTGATGNTLCSSANPDPYNNVNFTSTDPATWQHMTTFTLGLGASGNMQYTSSYRTATAGDYYNVKSGTLNNASSVPCSWSGASMPCNWPDPTPTEDGTRIDDLWHAAVNGHGVYFSATNPATLATGLAGALANIQAHLSASAAATTSNPNVTSGDNFVFSSTFTSAEWWGEMYRQQISTSGADIGQVSTTLDWVVSDCHAPTGYTLASTACDHLLDNVTYSSRKIYTYDPGNATASNTCDTSTTNQLKCFQYSDLTATQQGYFGSSKVSLLSQYSTLSSTDQTNMAGANLVNFIRGDRTNEGTLYHTRTHVLGDIVSSEAVYVKKPMFSYDNTTNDAGYSTFITNNSSRQGMVYVGANDGMLHAFNADNGSEMWAYVPSMLLPNLYKLAEANYANIHSFFVDGTPIVGDICISTTYNSTTGIYECNGATSWRTILVGGLSGGGSGYYALDITDPANPKALWEFTDSNMGYNFGNPVITKLQNGKWVVMFTSGYNNADGNGYLYVLDAATGANADSTKYPIATGVGSASTPSGLAKISAWVDDPLHNNTAQRVYGGDLLGNLWRFDINAASPSAVQLANFTVSGSPQPITTKPELGQISTNAVVFVGTGQYLGVTDLATTQQQSFYAIKDPLTATGWGDVRSNPLLYAQTLSSTTPTRTITANTHTVNFATDIGWYFDFPSAGSGAGSERSNTDPSLNLGTLTFTTNIPKADACTAGGYSWIYFIDYQTGLAVTTSTGGVAGRLLGNALATRPVMIRLPNGTVETLTRLSDGTTVKTDIPIGGAGLGLRRVNWRELLNN